MSRRIGVLQLIDSLDRGGAEALQVTFAAGIDRSRFDLHICAMRPCARSPVIPQLRELGYSVTEFKQRNSYDIPALADLMAYIRRNRIDIIHTHLHAADIMGRITGLLTGRPVVSTIHNNRKDIDGEPAHRQKLVRWTGRLLCRRLIVVSELLCEETIEWFGVEPSRVVAIANGVDTVRFHRGSEVERAAMKRSLIGGDYPLVTNAARMVPQKGLGYLLETAKIVTEARPDVRFVLAGDGVEREGLEAKAAALGITDKVVFTGFRRDIAGILASSDVFALSSLWEGMPVALLEAMAAGCVPVSTNVGGVAQVIEHEVNGLLVPPVNPQALAEAILECVNNPEHAEKLRETAQIWVNQKYGMEAWVRKLEDLYLQELQLSPNGRPSSTRQRA